MLNKKKAWSHPVKESGGKKVLNPRPSLPDPDHILPSSFREICSAVSAQACIKKQNK